MQIPHLSRRIFLESWYIQQCNDLTQKSTEFLVTHRIWIMDDHLSETLSLIIPTLGEWLARLCLRSVPTQNLYDYFKRKWRSFIFDELTLTCISTQIINSCWPAEAKNKLLFLFMIYNHCLKTYLRIWQGFFPS